MEDVKELFKNKLVEEYANLLTPEDFKDVNRRLYEKFKENYEHMFMPNGTQQSKPVQETATNNVAQPGVTPNVQPQVEPVKQPQTATPVKQPQAATPVKQPQPQAATPVKQPEAQKTTNAVGAQIDL